MESVLSKDIALWKVSYKVEKYHEDITPYARPRFHRNPLKWLWRYFKTKGKWEALFHSLFEPYEVREGEGNLLLNEGINTIWTLVCGGTATAYTSANARLGVGDSTTAASATQTGLLGTNQLYKGMDSGYPTYGTLQKVVFKASFGPTEANFAWNEWSVDNGAGPGMNLNRKVESLGVKSTGTWSLEVEISLS